MVQNGDKISKVWLVIWDGSNPEIQSNKESKGTIIKRSPVETMLSKLDAGSKNYYVWKNYTK